MRHLILLLLLVSPAAAQCADERLVGSSVGPGDWFGDSAHIDGLQLALGAPRENDAGTDSGAAYVYQLSAGAWAEEARVVSDDIANFDRFGASVALRDSALFVGATGERAVYVFQRGPGGWRGHSQKLVPSQGDDGFGTDLALSGDLLAIGAYTISPTNAVYVYERFGNPWVEVQRIPNVGVLDRFGQSVALEGERMVVGAPTTAGVGLGRAYVFERQAGTFVMTATLEAGDPQPAAFFGVEVDVEGDRIAVGAPFHGSPGLAQAGAVYVFELQGGTWVLVQQLFASDAQPNVGFGIDLDLEGDRLVIGANRHSASVFQQGAFYVFELEGGVWTETRKVVACEPMDVENFGTEIALDDGRVVVGARRSDAAGAESGAGWVVDVARRTGTRYCPAVSNSSGAPARTEVLGVPVVSANDLALATSDLPLDRFGYYLTSMTQGFLPMLGGGAGNLCLDLPIVRFANDILNSGSEGAVELTLDLTALPPGAAFLPGDTWSFQYWFRDVGNTSNTSDAVAITFETSGDPAVQFPVTLLSQVEETVQLAVAITLSQAAPHDVVVPFTTSGTATHDLDWRVEELNPIVIPAGETVYAMTLVVAEDAAPEGDETAVVTLGAPTGGVLGTAPRLTLTIVDDD